MASGRRGAEIKEWRLRQLICTMVWGRWKHTLVGRDEEIVFTLLIHFFDPIVLILIVDVVCLFMFSQALFVIFVKVDLKFKRKPTDYFKFLRQADTSAIERAPLRTFFITDIKLKEYK